jgi:ATP-dependent RNA helicase DeaD
LGKAPVGPYSLLLDDDFDDDDLFEELPTHKPPPKPAPSRREPPKKEPPRQPAAKAEPPRPSTAKPQAAKQRPAGAPPRRPEPVAKEAAPKDRQHKEHVQADRVEEAPPKREAVRKERGHKEPVHKEPVHKEPPPHEPVLREPVPHEPKAAPAHAKPRAKLPAASGFANMGLSETMLASLAEAEYLEPTPVQAGLIPRALAGVDVMGQARTGTGKTAAFAIPILERLDPHQRAPQALVLVPTRELAVQVRDECFKLAAGNPVHVVALYGGKPIRQQIDHLQRGAGLIVGTPGRVMDLMNRGSLTLGALRWVVLDEADRMLDIGFRPDIEKILRHCPGGRQTLLLSATIPPPVKRLAERYMREPEMLDFSAKDLDVETIEQFYFTVDPERKFDLLVQLVKREQPRQAIIFCRTRRGTDKVQRRLSGIMEGVDTIHGDLAQTARDRVMRRFREGKVQYLVATDVVGRGIDVTSISHIINYDIPQFCDDYVHRVGRTGRMGREGVAFTFVSPEEGNELTRIEMRINHLLKRDEMPGFQAFDKPQANENLLDEDDDDGPEPPKPVFGSRTKRYRRAL